MVDVVKFVDLPHDSARRIAYMELGCVDGTAKRSLLAVHGLLSCRLCAMPGISAQTLKEFGVRLIAIDRPGYGQSDPHRKQTFYSAMKDIEAVIDALDLGKKVWLLGFSMGGAFCWAAARYIPERIAGMALWSPVGNFKWKGISGRERKAMLASYTRTERALSAVARWLPFGAFRWYAKRLSKEFLKGPKLSKAGLSDEDWECLQQPGVGEEMARDAQEAVKYFKGFGVAKDLELMSGNWGFEMKEVGEVLQHAKVHIWHGDKDKLVPLRMQQWVQKQLPTIVTLHQLQGEGHLSWVCFNDQAHRETLSTIFQEEEEE